MLGRGGALFRVVRLGGHKVRKVRGNVSDANDDAGVFLYRDSSIAPLLDMRRRFKAVVDVLDATIRYGVSLARSVELTAQWDRILAVGPLYPVTLDDLGAVQGLGIGAFHHAVSDVHCRMRVPRRRNTSTLRPRCHPAWASEGTLVGPGKDTHSTPVPTRWEGRGWLDRTAR